MMRSSKRGADHKKSMSSHIQTLHQRLHEALNLGTISYENQARKWQCTDIQIQRHVVRSISTFLDSVAKNGTSHPLLKDSASDVIVALVCILSCKNLAMLSTTADAVQKLVKMLPNTILQSYVLDVVSPLSSLLSYHQVEIAMPCAIALNIILSNLSVKSERAVWEILKQSESIHHLSSQMRDFSGSTKPVDFFHWMASLLSTILLRWPSSRFPVWSDAKLMRTLNYMLTKPDKRGKVEVLKLLSATALCGSGASKLVGNGEAFLKMVVQCMEKSQPHSVRVEGFKLAQCLVINREGFSKLSCSECFVDAIISGMCKSSSNSTKGVVDQISLLVEACRLALITRWAGKHHLYFWKHGIDKVLLDLLQEDSCNIFNQQTLTLEEQLAIANQVTSAHYFLSLRGYIWDILGWLAAHCEDDFDPTVYGNELVVDILITCACLEFVDAIRNWHRVCQNDVSDALRSESAARAVVMLIYSPCKPIASKSRYIFSKIVELNGKEYLKHILHALNNATLGENFDMIQLVVYLVGLMCYLALPQYQKCCIEYEGMNTLLALVMWSLSNHFCVERLKFTSHLHNSYHGRTCCHFYMEEWEGENILLLYSLWGLAELIKQYGSLRNNVDIFAGQMAHTVSELVSKLQDICINTSTPGLRWYASYVLSSFGLYGYPSKLGERIGKVLSEKDHTDVKLVVTNIECSVHGIVLVIRCPSLLPLNLQPLNGQKSGCSAISYKERCDEFPKAIRLSARVDPQALVKLLEYLYFGYLQTTEELTKKLKTLAKFCDLQPLMQMLCRSRPKWGTLFPSCDLSMALGPLGYHFSDIVMESKSTELLEWKCSFCSVSVPHMHVHKVIVSASCEYLRALFNSGMQESHSRTIKVPVSWEAMVKLVVWFYSDKLPNPPSGCLWENMDTEQKLHELQPCVELCWLAEIWFLEDVQEACSNIIVSCLDSARHLSIKIIQLASYFSLWNLAEVAATYIAPSYRQLCDSGDLEELDEGLVDMIRAASVELSQEGGTSR